jgi:hypothetical protein
MNLKLKITEVDGQLICKNMFTIIDMEPLTGEPVYKIIENKEK